MKSFFSFITAFCVLYVSPVFAQSDKQKPELSIDLGADIVSRYVWRGASINAAPNIQPDVCFSFGDFSIGSWASYSTMGQYAEIDLYASYTIKSFTLTINDYYTENEADFKEYDYFNWSDTTNHALEFMGAYEFSEKFPLSVSLATVIFGNDKNDSSDNYYSTYVELGYPFQVNDYGVSVHAGFTTHEGMYADEANCVSLGVAVEKELAVSDRFKIPVSGNLIVNPKQEDIFFVFAISF